MKTAKTIFASIMLWLGLQTFSPAYTRNIDISRGNVNFKEIALTFDGHYSEGKIEQILKTLEEKNVGATFFLTGNFIKKYPQTVKKISEQGYEIENHTYYHKALAKLKNKRYLTSTTQKIVKDELRKTDSRLYNLVRKHMKFWRAPYGAFNRQIIDWSNEDHIYWTEDTIDWRKDGNLDARISNVLKKIQKDKYHGNGSIILMHVDSKIYEKLPGFIDRLKKLRYSLVTVEQILNDRQD